MNVSDLYQQYLGRAADQGGLDYWNQQFGDTVDASETGRFLKEAMANKEAQLLTDEGRQNALNLFNNANLEDFLGRTGAATTADEFWSKYGSAPQQGWNEETIRENSWGQDLGPLGYLGHAISGESGPMQQWLGSGKGMSRYDPETINKEALPTFSLYGSGSDEDIKRGFNVLQHMAPQNLNEFWGLDKDTQRGILQNPALALNQMYARANASSGDWLSTGAEGGYSDLGAYGWDAQKGLTADPSKYQEIHAGDSWSGPLSTIASIASVIPGPWQIPAMMVSAAMAARAGNPLGMAASVLPMTGVSGALANGVGDVTGNVLGQAGNRAVASGLMNTGMGLASGKDFDDALKSGAIAGLTSYGNSQLNSTINDTDLSPEQKAVLKGAGGAALNTAVKGGNLEDSLTSGLMGGLANYGAGLVSDVTGLDPSASGAITNAVMKYATNQNQGQPQPTFQAQPTLQTQQPQQVAQQTTSPEVAPTQVAQNNLPTDAGALPADNNLPWQLRWNPQQVAFGGLTPRGVYNPISWTA